mmetsp:Transcript_22157/g.53016  ORF Transcript_22157/g.53016 Transcript_22157/m.53016 type:complete len:397 (+) Transcript_22157:1153-2343(+)
MEEDVLRLEVAVDEPEPVEEAQALEHLLGYGLEAREVEVQVVPALPVVLLELIEICPEQLADDEEVLLVVEVVVHAEDARGVRRVRLVHVLQQLDLVQGLVKVVLVVLDDLEADEHPGLEVQRLDRSAERRGAEVVQYLVPPGDAVVDPDREVLRLLEAGVAPAVYDGEAEDLVPLLDLLRVVLHHHIVGPADGLGGRVGRLWLPRSQTPAAVSARAAARRLLSLARRPLSLFRLVLLRRSAAGVVLGIEDVELVRVGCLEGIDGLLLGLPLLLPQLGHLRQGARGRGGASSATAEGPPRGDGPEGAEPLLCRGVGAGLRDLQRLEHVQHLLRSLRLPVASCWHRVGARLLLVDLGRSAELLGSSRRIGWQLIKPAVVTRVADAAAPQSCPGVEDS